MKMKCVIIDDEPLARECLEQYVSQIDTLELVGSGTQPLELIQAIEKNAVDLMFLDIQMPVMNGIDFLKVLSNPPMAIITTAYPDFAIEGFQLDVLDYLLKPITFDRFYKAVNKAKDYKALQTRAAGDLPGSEEYFFVKSANKFERIYFNDILYVQGLQNYVTIFTTKGRYITHLTMKVVEENLNAKAFIRVHKSFIVAVHKIEGVENNELIIQSTRIPISRNYRNDVMEIVVNSKLWKK